MEKCCKLWMWLLIVPVVMAAQFDGAKEILQFYKSFKMHELMDREVKPCDDFYMHTCGHIGRHATNSKTFAETLIKSYQQKIRNFLNDSDTLSYNMEMVEMAEMAIKVQSFYSSCLNREQIKAERRQRLLDIMDEFGGMPALKGDDWPEESFDWLQVIGQILRKYGLPIIIGIEVEPDIYNTAVNRLYIGEVLGMQPHNMEGYFNYILREWETQLVELLDLDPKEALLTAREMAEFAEKLSKGVSDPLNDMGLHTKTKLTTLLDMDRKYGPTVNLTALVTTWLGHDHHHPAMAYEYVEDYMENLKRVIEETPIHTLANYILWTLLQKLDFATKDDNAQQERKCFKLSENYFYKYFDNRLYQQLETSHPLMLPQALTLFHHLKETFVRTLNSASLSWMTNQTKSQALEKLQAMEFHVVGYKSTNFTQLYGSLNLKSTTYITNVLELCHLQAEELRLKLSKPGSFENYKHPIFSPMYLQDYNLIAMPMYFMQPLQFWSNSQPQALLYGKMGFTIAHEMMHAFDDTGRLYDAKGNFHNWWDPKSADLFETSKDCVRHQYANFSNAEDFEFQGENIADISGLHVAYLAYEDWLSQHSEAKEVLPALMASYSPQQLFFISAAQMWCNKMATNYRNPMDTHSRKEVRVQGMMSNSVGFTEAFQCEAGAPMNPTKKCLIY